MKPVLIVQNCEAESAGLIIDYLSSKHIPFVELHSYRGDSYPNTDEIGSVICLGCPCSVNDYQQHDYLKQLYAFVSEITREDLPYLGICFGGQLLARVLGAKVERNKVKEIGTYTVRLTADGLADPVVSHLGHEFPVVQWHSDTFRVPFGRKLLAEGNDCRNQLFNNGKQFAMQFHLEATSSLLRTWCDTYPDELKEVGKTPDGVLSDFHKAADTIRDLNVRFLDGFIDISKEDQLTNHKPQHRHVKSE